MTKKIFAVVIVLLITGAGIREWCHTEKGANTSTNMKPTVKIGVSLPLSGEAAYIGAPSKIAAMMALEKWKSKNKRFNYQLVFENDQLSSRVSSTVANKMISLDKVRALITIWDVASPVNMEIAKRENIIHIGCTWGDGMSDGVNNFNNVSSHLQHGHKMLKLLQHQKVKKVGYVAQVVRGDLDLKKKLKNDLVKNGIEIVFEEEFHMGNKDFKTFFAKIKNISVDMMIVTMLPDDFNIFVKQKKEAGNTTPITTVDYFESIENKSLVEGAYYVISSPGNADFVEKMSQHTKTIGQCIGNVYAGVDLLVYAFENAGDGVNIPTTEEVAAYLRRIQNYDSVLGKLNVTENGHIDSPAIIRMIKNGQSVNADF